MLSSSFIARLARGHRTLWLTNHFNFSVTSRLFVYFDIFFSVFAFILCVLST